MKVRKRRQANQKGNKQMYETEGRIEREEDGEVRQRQQAKKKIGRKNELIKYLTEEMKLLRGVRGR
jgi:polyribonucleotide nucleotidyltransferase